MATSKTLTPTNVTIQIPEFTDQPDQRVNSNCIDKEADAINALNTQIANKVKAVTLEKTVNSGYFTINISTEIGTGYSIASINTVYKSGATADQLNLCYTIDENTVYVRTGSGNQLTSGTVIKVLVLGIK